jgi:hypothetical protein
MIRYLATIFALLLFLISALTGADIAVETTLDQNKGYIGDPLEFELKIIADSVIAVDTLEQPKDLGQFDLKNWRLVEDKLEGAKRKILYHAVLTAYETGKLIFPELPVIYHPKSEITDTIFTDSLNVYILSLVMDDSTADIRSLKDVKSLRASRQWLYLLISAVVVIAVALWFILRRKLQPESETVAPELLMSPWEAAREKLKKLQSSNLEAKLFYFELSEIILEYIERRWGLSAPDMTTYEIKLRLPGLDLSEEISGLLIELLDYADLVKFAKLDPTSEKRTDDFNKAVNFVDRTTPVEDKQEVAS